MNLLGTDFMAEFNVKVVARNGTFTLEFLDEEEE